jgi:hypothetical protein
MAKVRIPFTRNLARVVCLSTLPFSIVFCGCQTNPLTNTPWNSASRVPPPNAPSVLPSAPYAPMPGNGAATPGVPGVGVQPRPQGATNSQAATNSVLDPLNEAQNQLKLASDNARQAVSRSAQSINNGVVQASGTIQSAFGDALPLPPVVMSASGSRPATGSFAPDPSGIPGTGGYASSPQSNASGAASNPPTSGSIGDSAAGDPAAQLDPNAQWRKPTPR